jgi:hypothetical protein
MKKHRITLKNLYNQEDGRKMHQIIHAERAAILNEKTLGLYVRMGDNYWILVSKVCYAKRIESVETFD